MSERKDNEISRTQASFTAQETNIRMKLLVALLGEDTLLKGIDRKS